MTTGLSPRLRCSVPKLVPVNPITIPDQKPDVRIPGQCLREALSRPLSSRVRRYSELQDSAPREIEHDEYEERLEADRRNDGEVDGDGLVEMISEKSPPALARTVAG